MWGKIQLIFFVFRFATGYVFHYAKIWEQERYFHFNNYL